METLLQEVRELGESLSAHLLPDFDLRPMFRTMTLGTQKKGHLLDLDKEGKVILNTAHPLATRLMDGKPGRPYVLVAAVVSLVNRAEEALTDEHQRQLHHHLLQFLTA